MDNKDLTLDELWEMPEEQRWTPEVLSQLSSEDLRSIIEEYEISPQIYEAIFEELKKRDPTLVNGELHISNINKGNNNYPALTFIAMVFRLFGWILIIAGLILGAYFMSEVSVYVGIISFIVASFYALLSFACAEVIKVFTDISTSSFRIINHLENNK